MKRSSAGAIALAAIIVLLAASAAAVEVTVKTDTKLYGRDGKVVREVAAGQAFKAERRHEAWVWGFLPTHGGGVRGWIKLDDLNLDEDALRKLGASAAADAAAAADATSTSSTTQPTTPTTPTQPTTPTVRTTPTVTRDSTPADGPVVLRYRLKQRELQVYDVSQELSAKFSAGDQTMSLEGTVTQLIRLRYGVQGVRLAPDGATVADVRFHALQYRQDTVIGNAETRVEGDEKGATLYRNGAQVYSGKWGARELIGVPDFSKYLNTTYTVHFTDRGQAQLESAAKRIGDIALEDMFGGDCVFPEGPVHPGMSWTADISRDFANPADPDTEVPLVGKATYTVLDRTTHRNRRCVKIGIDAEMKEGQAPAGAQMNATMKGVSYVDETTGIRLDTQLDVSINLTGTLVGRQMQMTGSAKLTVSYKGNRLNN
jgi:hypothetical protein